MSWQQRRFHGRWDFGRFPLLNLEADSAALDLGSKIREAVEKPGALGKIGREL